MAAAQIRCCYAIVLLGLRREWFLATCGRWLMLAVAAAVRFSPWELP